MKKTLKIFMIIGLILVMGYTFAQIKLKSILTRELSKSLTRQVYIGKVGLGLPLHAYVKNLVIFEPLQEGKALNEFARINEIRISPAVLPFLRGRLLLRAVYIFRPQINIVKIDKDRFNFSDLLTAKGEIAKIEGKKQMPLLILKLRIKDGPINFTDTTISELPRKLSLRDLDFYITKIAFPLTDIATRYDLKAKIQEDALEDMAAICSSGWLNFTKKDMEANLSLKNLDINYLTPYYQKFISGRVKFGLLNFYSDIISRNNDLIVKCKLEIENLNIEASPESTILGVPVVNFIETLKDSGNKLSLDFEIKTKFDQPKINFAQIGSSILSRALEKAALKMPKFILDITEKAKESKEGGLKEITDKLKAIGEELQKTLGK